jgi:BirA family biotin operon repressor/biotin-[acetyl-CoA-carboxylase] ligase
VVSETGSTNADLIAAAASGAPDRTVLVAHHQTAGRGRLDRRWEAPPGSNLLVSMLFRPLPHPPQRATWLVALAARRACGALTGLDVGIKWPNDLLVGDAKLAGLLAQVAGDAVVVGLGLNVGWAPDGAARLGDGIDPVVVLARILTELDELAPSTNAELLAAYREASATLRRRVRAELPGGSVLEGRAVDVADDGRLIVLDDCAVTHRLDVADVVHMRSSTPD